MKSNVEWKKWGEIDPLYAVASWKNRERTGSNPWTDEEFYNLGRSDWNDFQKHWKQYGLDFGHCIEIGCGAGRITAQLSAHFEHVSAFDVSEHQIDYAKKRLAAANVDFQTTNGLQIPLPDQQATAAFSVHVFQHFESHRDALLVFRELHRTLKPGGTLMVHLPIYDLPDVKIAALFRRALVFTKRLSDLKAGVHRALMVRGKARPVMRRLRFERAKLIEMVQSIGFVDIEFHLFPVQSNGSYHEFLFSTKPR
jgi:SAM-dependent methyltransferase